MGTNKIWNVRYKVGTLDRVATEASSPYRRRGAIAVARDIATVAGWHAWVEHAATGVRIWDSQPAASGKKRSG